MQKLKLISDLWKLICPKLIGKDNEFAKRVLALQLCTIPESDDERFNLMLVGEPGSGKSMLGFDLSKLVPNSAYVSADTTRVGLREVLQNCHKGFLLMDEFDELTNQQRQPLLDAMQLGELPTHKHGYHDTAETKLNVISICNPRNMLFQSGMSMISQLPYPLKLIQRFHLFVPFYAPESKLYRPIAIDYGKQSNDKDRRDNLFEYLLNLKEKFPKIEIPEEIRVNIADYVAFLKNRYPSWDTYISPRFMFGIFSMLKGCARMNHRKEVNEEDYKYIRKITDELFLHR